VRSPATLNSSAPVLDAVGLARDFSTATGSIAAVKDVSLRVASGQIVAVLGPNGAGKSTTLRMCATLLLPTRGSIHLSGIDAVRLPRQARRHLGLAVGGDRGFYMRASVRENLGFFALLWGMGGRQLRARLSLVLEQVGLTDVQHRAVETLSTGMRQRLHIARAIVHSPSVLLLDEPTTGLDPEAAVSIRELIDGLREDGTAILLTTHYLHEAERLADEITIIAQGVVVARGGVRDIAQLGKVGDVTSFVLSAVNDVLLSQLSGIEDVVDIRVSQAEGRRLVAVTWAVGRTSLPFLTKLISPLSPEYMTTRPATLEEAYLALVAGMRSRA